MSLKVVQFDRKEDKFQSELVEFLETQVTRAKAGEFRAIALTAVCSDGSPSLATKYGDGDRLAILGAMAWGRIVDVKTDNLVVPAQPKEPDDGT